MMRFSMLLLVLVLFGAAAGRYQAESDLRQTRQDISDLQTTRAAALSEINLLRAEIAYLENPDRLALIAEKATTLQPLSSRQLMTTEEFLAKFSGPAAPEEPAPVRRELAVADNGAR